MKELIKLQQEYNFYYFQLQGEIEGSPDYSLLLNMLHNVLDDIEEAQQLSNKHIKTSTSTIEYLLKQSKETIPLYITGKYTTIGMN